MFSGSVRGAVKPITVVALEVYPTIGSAPADLMMSRALTYAGSSTGRIPDCNRTAAHSSVLDGGVHTRLSNDIVTIPKPNVQRTKRSPLLSARRNQLAA